MNPNRVHHNIALPASLACTAVGSLLLLFSMESGKKRKQNKLPWVPEADRRSRKKKLAEGNVRGTVFVMEGLHTCTLFVLARQLQGL